MENRERDRVSQRTAPTEAGDLNRRTEAGNGREHHKDTSAEFGQKIGRSEKLEGGDMRNRNEDSKSNIESNLDKEVGNEYTRRPNNDFDSSTKEQGGSEKWRDEDKNDISRDDLGGKDSGSMGSPSGRH